MPDERPAERDERRREPVDARLHRLARHARWVLTTEEMLAGGLSRSAIDRRRGQVLTQLFHGVHLYGRTVPTREEQMRAAVKATRNGHLAGRTAGDHWGVWKWRGDIEMIVPTDRRRQPGLHPRTRILHPRDVTQRRGLPVTTLARTYIDLAGALTSDELGRAVHEGDVRKILRVDAIDEAMARAGNFHGRANLMRALARHRKVDGRLDSGLERRFHRFLRDHGFPPSEHNRLFELGDDEFASIDALFPEHWFGVEIDSAAHRTVQMHDSDRRRDRRVRAVHDLPIMRITDTDLDLRPAETAADLWISLRRREGFGDRRRKAR